MDHTTVHRVNIDELETHDVKRVANLRNPVTQKLVLEWKVDGVHPANLLELLENKPDGKIVFVDCQDAKENEKSQFKNAIHLNIRDGKVGQVVFSDLWKADPKSLQGILGADLVVFYCSFSLARSPSAMTSYLYLMDTLRAKRPQRPQKVVLLDGGIKGFVSLKATTKSKYLKPWGSLTPGSKKLVQIRGDTKLPEDMITLYTEPDAPVSTSRSK